MFPTVQIFRSTTGDKVGNCPVYFARCFFRDVTTVAVVHWWLIFGFKSTGSGPGSLKPFIIDNAVGMDCNGRNYGIFTIHRAQFLHFWDVEINQRGADFLNVSSSSLNGMNGKGLEKKKKIEALR